MSGTEIAAKPAFSLTPQSIDEAIRLADLMSKSNIVPKDYINNPGNILVAMQWGMELGLQPLQAMQNIAVINGRPSLWGDAVLALVLSHPSCQDVVETYEGEGNNLTAVCVAKRKGRADKTARFSIADATSAGLIGKSGPWTSYRDRMLKMRARAFALRDQFADVLKGMAVAEEEQDLKDMGAAVRVDTQSSTQQQAGNSEKSALPAYSDDELQAKSAGWKTAFANKKSNAEHLISTISTKYTLSDTQKAKIRALETPAETVIDNETGEVIGGNSNG